MTELSGWHREEVLGKMLLGEVFGTQASCCRLKNEEAVVNLGIALNSAGCCQEPESISFGFFARSGQYRECLLCTNRELNAEGEVTGTFCFLQLASPKTMQVHHFERVAEQTTAIIMKTIAYVKRQVRNPLAEVLYTGKMLEGIYLNKEDKKSLHKCQLQLNEILDHTDIDSMIDRYLQFKSISYCLAYIFLSKKYNSTYFAGT